MIARSRTPHGWISTALLLRTGAKSRSATQFEEIDWFEQLRRALRIEELVTKHIEIMDKYDPQKRVALIVVSGVLARR